MPPLIVKCWPFNWLSELSEWIWHIFNNFVFVLFLKGNKMGLSSAAHHAAAAAAAASSLQFFYQGGDPLGQPPPAHMGIPPYQLDPKTAGAMGNTTRTHSPIVLIDWLINNMSDVCRFIFYFCLFLFLLVWKEEEEEEKGHRILISYCATL